MDEKKSDLRSIGGGRIAILSSFALVLLFLFAFGCYGCAYQSPLVVPDEQEATLTLLHLVETSWTLDTAAGEQGLPELYNVPITSLEFGSHLNDDGSLAVTIRVKGRPPMMAQFIHEAGRGLFMLIGDDESNIRVSHSTSKDGKSQTITFRGAESNAQCYFLKN